MRARRSKCVRVAKDGSCSIVRCAPRTRLRTHQRCVAPAPTPFTLCLFNAHRLVPSALFSASLCSGRSCAPYNLRANRHLTHLPSTATSLSCNQARYIFPSTTVLFLAVALQIRVHLQFLGHPIVNDNIYGPHADAPASPCTAWRHGAGLRQHPRRLLSAGPAQAGADGKGAAPKRNAGGSRRYKWELAAGAGTEQGIGKLEGQTPVLEQNGVSEADEDGPRQAPCGGRCGPEWGQAGAGGWHMREERCAPGHHVLKLPSSCGTSCVSSKPLVPFPLKKKYAEGVPYAHTAHRIAATPVYAPYGPLAFHA